MEVPRAEYSYDAAVNLIVELNDQYNPAWIYCDSGSGEYQIERLHIIGEERPATGLRNKVKRMNFKQSLDIILMLDKDNKACNAYLIVKRADRKLTLQTRNFHCIKLAHFIFLSLLYGWYC